MIKAVRGVQMGTSSYAGVAGLNSPLIDLHTADNSTVTQSGYTDGVFGPSTSVRFRDMTDGSSNVALVGEKSTLHQVNDSESRWAGVGWNKCAQCSDGGVFLAVGVMDPAFPINSDGGYDGFREERVFASRHEGGAHFLFGDGRVRFLSENMDADTYGLLGRRDDGNVGGEY